MYSDLELLIRRSTEDSYTVDIRFSAPGQDTDERPLSGEDGTIQIPIASLLKHGIDWHKYGLELSQAVFRGKIKDQFQLLRAASERAGASGMRIRLLIDSSAKELHNLQWETIADPDGSGESLCINERIAFSRYLSSTDPRPIRSRPRGQLDAFIAIANPSSEKLPDIDVTTELARARTALGDKIAISTLTEPGTVTLSNLLAGVRKGCDILYLICHGALRPDGGARLFLESEDEQGSLRGVPAEDLVRGIQQMQERPRLIVLASCQSAGRVKSVDDAFLKALGPRLAEVGVPAVIAMSGEISIDTSSKFMRTFFEALTGDRSPCAGQIDQAMTVARFKVREEKDYWGPILFLRLKSGRIWYTPGFNNTGAATLTTWRSITQFASKGTVIPIIGPEIAERFFGSIQDIAAQLAADLRVPLPVWEQNDTAKVSQFYASPSDFLQEMNGLLLNNARTKLANPAEGASKLDMQALIGMALDRDDNPYNILASKVRAKVYITANADGMLAAALRRCDRRPLELVCNWRDDRRLEYEAEEPTEKRPIVYYMFGREDDVSSLVLTEDDFFDYMINMSKSDLMPINVSGALPLNSLMFLGFPLDDWKFRILYRLILGVKGMSKHLLFNHVGVQVNPEEEVVRDVESAQTHLKSYFQQKKTELYWGTAASFLSELKDRLEAKP